MTTLPRFDSINLGDSSVPADAQEQFARLAAAAGEQEPWTTPEQIPVGHLYSEDAVSYTHLTLPTKRIV